jgi:glycogen debranching enzyme
MSNLTARQLKRKERTLNQRQATNVRETASATVVKQGDLSFLTTGSGEVPWRLPHGLGLYFRDCRFLNGYTLTVSDQDFTTLASLSMHGFEAWHELTNPEMQDDAGGEPLRQHTLELRRQHMIQDDVLHDCVLLHNFGSQPAHLTLCLRFRSRFEDIFSVKGFTPGPRGTLRKPCVVDTDQVELAYDGRDGRCRATSLAFSPAPTTLEPTHATFVWTLKPGEQRTLTVTIAPTVQDSVDAPSPSAPRHIEPKAAARAPRGSTAGATNADELEGSTAVRTSSDLLNRILRRSLLDLRMLRSVKDGLHYYSAGLPWFATLFGRDAITAALETLLYHPDIARDTLSLLAHYQAHHVDTYRDAEPGKILHELRHGELAHLGVIPQSPAYYGTIDATLLFLILLHQYVRWTGDLDLARQLRPNVEAALNWMVTYADHNGDGFLDYVGEHQNGPVNQGWKDSGIAIVNDDGSLAKPPIALCEVQAYAFRAWRETAALLRALGEDEQAVELDGRASTLAERFERDYWSEELGCYVLALQQDGRPAAVVASNTGQVLWGGICSAERAARVADRLLKPDMWSGWGIRTLSSDAAAYNPLDYQVGSVWPHDNALIAQGFRRYGLDDPALRVFTDVVGAASRFPHFRLPELYCGFKRHEQQDRPVQYPVACNPQAWAAGSVPYALDGLLGLRPDAVSHHLAIARPCLPAWLPWVELSGVRVGEASVDLRFERTGSDGRAEVRPTSCSGQLDIDILDEIPPADAFGVSARGAE